MGETIDPEYAALCAETVRLEEQAVRERDATGAVNEATLVAYRQNQEAHMAYQTAHPRPSFLGQPAAARPGMS